MKASGEGVRVVRVKSAKAEYDVAPLPDGRWAVWYAMEYGMSGSRSPWTAYATREECSEAFLSDARRRFAARHVTDMRDETRRRMLKLLGKGVLFGFIEPDPSESA